MTRGQLKQVCHRGDACVIGAVEQPLSAFASSITSKAGVRGTCRACENQAVTERRRSSAYAPLTAEDFNAENEGRRDAAYSKEKRQEFSEYMGDLHGALRQHGPHPEKWPRHLREYAQEFLAEQENRMRNRRAARSFSLTAANDALLVRQLREFAGELTGRIVPVGHAFKRNTRRIKRSIVALWSDFHFGSDLSELDNPVPFGAIQEARRLEAIVCQVRDYKPQHRADTRLELILAGDMIEGKLHDLQDGAPTAEQMIIFWELLGQAIGVLAGAYLEVHVTCQVGNHGRNKLRHPGRATSSKWDSLEWAMYQGLARMSSHLKNVTWDVPTRPWSMIKLHGSNLLITHSDTEVKILHPGKNLAANSRELARINAVQRYGETFDAFGCGHWHTAMFVPGYGRYVAQVYNGMLVPPAGYARAGGYDDSPCGQMLWEAVEGHPVGDLRFCAVDERTDADEKLGKMIKPFRITDKEKP